MSLPTKLAIVKCKVHKTDDSFGTRGNTVADKAAKKAAVGPTQMMALINPGKVGERHPKERNSHLVELQNNCEITELFNNCEICIKNNVRKNFTAPIGHIPEPMGPFRHLMIHYVYMGAENRKGRKGTFW